MQTLGSTNSMPAPAPAPAPTPAPAPAPAATFQPDYAPAGMVSKALGSAQGQEETTTLMDQSGYASPAAVQAALKKKAPGGSANKLQGAYFTSNGAGGVLAKAKKPTEPAVSYSDIFGASSA